MELEKFNLLNDLNSQIDEEGTTPLMFAVLNQNPELVKTLIERGADPGLVTNGMTPLIMAVFIQNLEIVKILLETRKANIEFRDENGNDALFYCSKLKIAQLLLEHGNFNFANENEKGDNYLMDAIREEKFKMVPLLAEKSKDLFYVKDSNGNTPFIFAIRYGDNGAMKALLDAGVDPNYKYGRTTALQVAEECEDWEAIRILKEYGANE